MRWLDLIIFVGSKLEKHPCKCNMNWVQRYCQLHNLYFAEVCKALEAGGAYCDCEVMLNASESIPLLEQITSPHKALAIEVEIREEI